MPLRLPARSLARTTHRVWAASVAGAALAASLATPQASASDGASATSPPTTSHFVQAGTPGPLRGQVVPWGDGKGHQEDPDALPAGVYAVAVSSSSDTLLVLRSDGQADFYGSQTGKVPALPDGVRYVAVSAYFRGGYLLRSDGVIVSTDGWPTTATVTFTAVSGSVALTSSGTIARPDNGATADCSAGAVPATGTVYTAVSGRSTNQSWSAVRSDGAVVSCDELHPGTATTTLPPAGTKFVGVETRRGPALAVTADDRIVSLDGSATPTVPAGRHVVSLAATGPGVGAATLDDGTLLRWGLPASNVPPVVPADRAVFSAVDLVGDVGWTIMAGDPIPVVASVDVDRPVGRPLRVTDGLVVHVNAVMDDGEQAPGSALVTLADPAGQTRVQQWTSVSPDAAPLGFPQVGPLQGQSTPPGPFRLTAEFHGSPFTTTAAATDLDIGGPSPVHVVTSGSSTWRATSPDTLCLQVVSDDGSPLWWGGGFEVSVDEQPTKTIGGGTTGYECLSILGLSPGTYTAHFSYGTYGYVWETPVEADWSGTITVLEPAVSTLAADVPETWAYDARPSSFPFKVTAEELVPRGYVRVATDGQDIGVADVTSGQLPLRSDLLLPGTHQLTFTFDGGFGALPATLERTVVVTPATFTGSRPRISGVPVVGQTLTVDIGSWTPWPATTTFVWRVGGQVWSSTTSSTFVVPPSAAGKLVSVTVTGTSPGYAPLSETTKPFLALPAVPASGPVPRLG